MVWVRPMNTKENEWNCKDIIALNKKERFVTFNENFESAPWKLYTYDNVFDGDDPQEEVYKKSAYDIVEMVIEGYNGTIFAYG